MTLRLWCYYHLIDMGNLAFEIRDYPVGLLFASWANRIAPYWLRMSINDDLGAVIITLTREF